MNHSTRAGAGLVAAILALGAGPTTAMAAPVSDSYAVQHHANHHGHKFNLTGLVSAADGIHLRVLVGNGRLGHQQLARRSVQLDLRARGHHASPDVGDSIHAQGTARTAAGAFDASQFEVQASGDSGALVGVLDAVDGTTLLVNVSAQIDGQGGQGDGEGGQGDGEGDQSDGAAMDAQDGGDVAVDASQATVSLDGQPAAVAELATGDTVAVLGETDDDSALATQVLGFSTAQATAEGTITQMNGTVLTLAPGDGDSGGDGGSDGSTTTVDVSGSQIFLDGQSTATVSQLATGDDVLAVGTAGTDPLAATVTFAFGQGGDGQGGDGQGD